MAKKKEKAAATVSFETIEEIAHLPPESIARIKPDYDCNILHIFLEEGVTIPRREDSHGANHR